MSVPRNPYDDPALAEYRPFLERRSRDFREERDRILREYGSLAAYADLHAFLGLHKVREAGVPLWRMEEYMPGADTVWLTTDRIRFQRQASHRFRPLGDGLFRLDLPEDALGHGTYMELRVLTKADAAKDGGVLRRIPAFADWVEQDKANPNQWCARVHAPEHPHVFRNPRPPRRGFVRIYEAHVGMAQPSSAHSADHFGTYRDFAANILPRIRDDGYTAVQLMGVPEHPLYKSFGYQVGSFFAPSSRYGTPEEFKALVDEAHGLGLSIYLDITHSHACSNTEQGLAAYDGTRYLFSDRDNQWGTPTFDYANEMTRRFLLSNCRYWLEEYMVDGFRFDAVGNMLYTDLGRNDDFSHVGRCFYDTAGAPRANVWGETYICLANDLVHGLVPGSVTIAEEFSGMPGLTSAPARGGLGFDYRFAMGIPDYWTKFLEEPRDMGSVWYEMTNHRPYDRTVSYVECHDQCINGDDAMIWRLMGKDMYSHMALHTDLWSVSRGLALYKLMRLVTLACADAGYLNFMGNEFGHPEWLDAEEHGHRQWHLAERKDLKYAGLARFDKALMWDLVEAWPEAFAVQPLFRYVHEDDRILAFERGPLLFTFNFHELRAREDLRFAVTPGKYVERLSTDDRAFSGSGNLQPGDPPVEHFSQVLPDRAEQDVILYLPPMTGLVMVRE
ncbi:MAG: alpha amylase C-terminal domain-containing protein [Desulfovibrio sp.]|jgi:1,4-alpha-glucan branching enzyme|nr:alpha amylase C-terminal domain-containing protein [Desulfovibrio sp.]